MSENQITNQLLSEDVKKLTKHFNELKQYTDQHIEPTVVDSDLEFKKFMYIEKAKKQAALFSALAKAQGDFPIIERDKIVTVKMKSGGSYNFAYADLASINKAIKAPLALNGLSLTHSLKPAERGFMLITSLNHSDGGCVSSSVALADKGDPQAFGSQLTYYKRYNLSSLVNVDSEEDDDGNNASGNATEPMSKADYKQSKGQGSTPATVSDGQLKRLYAITMKANRTPAWVDGMVKKKWGLKSKNELNKEKYDIVCDFLEKNPAPKPETPAQEVEQAFEPETYFDNTPPADDDNPFGPDMDDITGGAI